MTRLTLPTAGLTAAVLALTLTPVPVRGDATAPAEGVRADVVAETALVVWDAASKTEHLVRRVTFQTPAGDFGFLVPTPTRPQVAEADADVFKELTKLTAPKVETRTVAASPEFDFRLRGWGGSGSGTPPPPPTQVQERKQTGGLEHKTFAATDAGEVEKWLADNKYPVRPGLKEWLAGYAKKGWVVTAFKVTGPAAEGGSGSPDLTGATVRLTFQADRPVYPYAEPAGQADEAADVGRLLRLYVVGAGRVAGKVGDGSAAWGGRTLWADAVTADQAAGLAGGNKLPAAPAGWLTEFEDRESQRPAGDDLAFDPAADQAAVARPPIVWVQYDYSAWYLKAAAIGAAAVVALIAAIIPLRRALRRKPKPGTPPAPAQPV